MRIKLELELPLNFAKQQIPVLAGPTASGKTAWSLEIGQKYPIEIVSADAMMVYRGLDIGTAKPNIDERQLIPHHLIDIIDVTADFSVKEWVELAERDIEDILSRNKIPFIVGGTGFYVRSLTEGLPTTPPSDQNMIFELEKELKERGLDDLLIELAKISPFDAEKTQRNPRRVLRALEIIRTTGQPPSVFALRKSRFSFKKFILDLPKQTLNNKIEERTKKIFASGFVDEVKGLLRLWGKVERRPTALQAIGYQQVIDHLTGKISLDEAYQRTLLATMQYAKRQITWFKNEKNAIYLEKPDELFAIFQSQTSQ